MTLLLLVAVAFLAYSNGANDNFKGVGNLVGGRRAVGGLRDARKVAEIMSVKIIGMNFDQGFAANLSTALLITTTSLHGLPVGTTHLSGGSLLGPGVAPGQTEWRPVCSSVLAAWMIILPCAALVGALAYLAIEL